MNPTPPPPAECDGEHVILVHGTFASSAEDSGSGWWQVDSEPYKTLQERLPQNVRIASKGKLFRWSGRNTERARSQAAVELLRHIEPLERAGQRYHLIGHSHGGSVIWAALRLATAKRKKLGHLHSWTTVGTPFLQHRSKSPWSPMNVAYMLLAAFLLYPAWRCFRLFAVLPYNLMTGKFDNGIMLPPIEEVGYVAALVRTPVIRGLELVGVPFTATPNGVRMSSFDPQSGQSVSHFLFGTYEGWLILGAIVLFGYSMLLLSCYFLSSVSEGLRIGLEKRLEQRAFDEYGKKWLGLWTPDDEAINGLRATMELTVSFVGNLVVRERIFLSDLISVPWRPIYRLFAPCYNKIVRPLLDSKIREIVIKTAQGNDRPAAQVVAVSPHPVDPPPASTVPPLPVALADRIRERADKQANELGPQIRKLLAEPSLMSGLERFSKTLSGKELVHTSYFDHPEVIDLLAMNIAFARRRVLPRRTTASPELETWFDAFKQLQGAAPKTSSRQRPRLSSLSDAA